MIQSRQQWRSLSRARCLHSLSTSRGVAALTVLKRRFSPRFGNAPVRPTHHQHPSSLTTHRQANASYIQCRRAEKSWLFSGVWSAQRRALSTSLKGAQAQQAVLAQDEDDVPDPSPAPSSESTREEYLSESHIRHVQVRLDNSIISPMISTLRDARSLGLSDTAQTYPAAPLRPETALWHPRQRGLNELSRQLASEWKIKSEEPAFRARLKERQRLPVMAENVRNNVIKSLQGVDALVVVANTGSGKTTQVPQIILDHYIQSGMGAYCNISITQPRRISATSIARRVAHERDEPVGHSVGWHVRFSSRYPSQKGSILYCTAGVLLKRLQSRQDMILGLSHIIIDEVHERNVSTDCILTLLRELLRSRKAQHLPFPKLILMSATIDSELFVNYLREPGNGCYGLVTRSINVEGRLFPVTTRYLNDLLPGLQRHSQENVSISGFLKGVKADKSTSLYLEEELRFADVARKSAHVVQSEASAEEEEDDDDDDDETETDETERAILEPKAAAEELPVPTGLMAATVLHVLETSSRGDVLVFAVGMADIEKVTELLLNDPMYGPKFQARTKWRLFKLHSSLADTNDSVFADIPAGCRRVVLATNIAETSITLPQVEYVIDLGKSRQMNFDQRNSSHAFPATWISKDNQQQRRGRAGRVQPGHYLGLYTQERYESFEQSTRPEMTRIDLVDVCLTLKSLPASTQVREFLAHAPNPPLPEKVDSALLYLQRMGALTANDEITPLGKLLASIPIHPSLMKAVLLGMLFHCLEPMLIFACLNLDDPLVVHPTEMGKVAVSRRMFAAGSESDLLAYINAFKEYDAADRNEDLIAMHHLQRDRYVHNGNFRELQRVARQVYEELSIAGLLPWPQACRSVFEVIPARFNENAENIPLVKALMMNVLNSDVAIRRGRNKKLWSTTNKTKSLLAHRSVNLTPSHDDMTPRKVRKPDDFISFMTKRQELDGHVWIAHTNMITPLMAILFGRTAIEAGSGILLNKWIQMRVDGGSRLDKPTTIRVLLEFRKAFDRFCTLAFSDLEEAATVARTEWSMSSKNDRFDRLISDIKEEIFPRKKTPNIGAELRETFVAGVLKVLEADDKALQEQFAQDFMEEQEREAQESAEKERRKASKERLATKAV